MEGYQEKRRVRGEYLYPIEVDTQARKGKGMMAKTHYHDCIEILYAQSGEYEAQLGGVRHRFAKGDMLLIHTNEPHMVMAQGEAENCYLVLKFYPELLFSGEQTVQEMKYLDAFAGSSKIRQQLFSQCELEQSGIPALFYEIKEEFEKKEFGFEMALRILICKLFLWVLRHWSRQGISVLESSKKNEEVLRKLQTVVDYVECNYGDAITLQTAAQNSAMGYSAFSKFFSANTGKSFIEYLTEVRLSKAKIMLATTGTSITGIALETGFSTTSYFIAQFRRSNGMTPRKYREMFTRQPVALS